MTESMAQHAIQDEIMLAKAENEAREAEEKAVIQARLAAKAEKEKASDALAKNKARREKEVPSEPVEEVEGDGDIV